ncbi:MAG: MFS transporter [Chloroflexi bacterium]|nr:MFS transporter [Chloroflexota bacterium]MBT4073387.1 MFS transporter [Chloroflexota bacterium]MBT4514768.1 MFS transporter [Chloroflexota bacterium]MBT5320512.1 MFS transporter [Chloroflexota bacterium]MBT6681066.1 MFS transporter [Chloroflexota bacterium]
MDDQNKNPVPVKEREGTFYGWYIVGAMFFATFIGVGTRQGFGVFVKVWEEDFGVSVGLISVAAGIGWTVNGLIQPLSGRLTDAFGGRRVLIVSLALMGVGTIAIAAVPNVYVLIAVYGFFLSAAAGGVFPTPMTSVVSRWFQRKRGRAMSFVAAGGSAGGLIMVPFAAYLLIATDWRVAWLAMGAIILLLGLPLLAIVVRSDPADMGLEQDGGPEEEGEDSHSHGRPTIRVAPPLETKNWRDSFHSAPMWQLSLAFWVCGITTATIAVHFVRWAESEDISAGTAALAFGVLSAINGVGLILVGSISDLMPRKYLLGAVYWVRGLAFLALMLLPGTTALWAFAVLGGVSWLATVPLTTGLTADVYGLRNVGTINGLINMAHQLGGGLAVVVAGFVFDIWDTYDPVFAAGAIFLGLAGLASFAIRERKYSIRYQPMPEATSLPPIPAASAASDGD